jgi:NAD(P)-dependent dehydrogenase (short-subunit alcohol dehydrogenase family)
MNAVKPEWLGAGIRVNGIAPGIIDTQMTQQAATNELTKSAFEQIPIPINRWGKPEEMAEPIAFLLSTASSYIVGQTIFADGGIDALLQPTAHPHPLPPLK